MTYYLLDAHATNWKHNENNKKAEDDALIVTGYYRLLTISHGKKTMKTVSHGFANHRVGHGRPDETGRPVPSTESKLDGTNTW
jgi:hypothetical protein